MDAYSLTAVIVVTVGAATVACFYLFTKAGREVAKDVAETARAPVEAGERVAVEALDTTKAVAVTAAVTAGVVATRTVAAGEAVVTQAIEAARATAEPVSKGVSEICRAIAGRIDSKRSELCELREEIGKLTQENARLRTRRISIDQIKPIFQIAFFQSELSERDFVKEVVKTVPGGRIQRDEAIEYLGVYRGKNTQKFGVDLEELKFQITSPTVIQVSGLGKTKLIGNLHTEVKDEHVELRRHLTGGKLHEVHEILSGDVENLKLERDRRQRNDVHVAITQERRIHQIEQGVEMMTLQLLKDHFGPRGYSVIKAAEPIAGGLSIAEVQDSLNAQIAHTLEANTKRLEIAQAAQDEAEQVVKTEIEKLKAGDFAVPARA